MNNKIIIINGPNLNLLGEKRTITIWINYFGKSKRKLSKKSKELGLNVDFAQSNIEGEIVNIIQDSEKKF